MNLFLFIFFLIFLNIEFSKSTEFLKFIDDTSESDTLRRTYNVYHKGSKFMKVFARTANNVIVDITKIYNKRYPKLKFNCRVEELSKGYELFQAFLVYHDTVENKTTEIDGLKTSGYNVEFEYAVKGDKYTGLEFLIKFKRNRDKSFDGKFFCKLKNGNGEIISNTVEIRDTVYYQHRMVEEIGVEDKRINDLKWSSFPITLQCLNKKPTVFPTWAKNSVLQNVEWKSCVFNERKVVDQNECFASVDLEDVSVYFISKQLYNGDIILFNRTEKPWKPMGFVCKYGGNVYTTYLGLTGKKKGRLLDFEEAPQNIPFEPLSDRDQEITVEPKRYNPNFELYLKYKYSRGLTWKSDVSLDSFTQNNFMLKFPSKIEKKHQGVYYLGENNEFKISLLVAAQPQVKKQPPSSFFVMSNKKASFSAEFIDFTGEKYTINGDEPSESSLSDIQSSIKRSKNAVTYTALNLNPDKSTGKSKSHNVEITAFNKYGHVLTNTFVRVFPVPDLKSVLKNGICLDDCSIRKPHTFKCDFDLKPYENVATEITWFYNNQNLSENEMSNKMKNFTSVNGNKLTVKPFGNQTFLQKFPHKNLRCRLRILDKNQGVVYDSDDEKDFLMVKMVPDEPIITDTRNAEMTWIASVITAVVIILVIALLITWFCTRNRGEVYLLNDYEKKCGNDPDKEMRDHSTFQAYERPDTTVVNQCKGAIEDGDIEVNSNDDDAECDYSDDLISKFNETGSFINGPYGDRSLPPRDVDALLSKNNC